MVKKLLLILLTLSFFSTTALAWDDCPFGLVNDTYPGECGSYTDTNSDGLCDHSQPEPIVKSNIVSAASSDEEVEDLISGQDLKTKTVEEVAQIYEINAAEYSSALSEYYKVNIKETDSFGLLHDNYGLEPSTAKDIALSLKTGNEMSITQKEKESKYHFPAIAISLIVLYSLSYFLSKKKIISVINHRKIWNIFLTISFLVLGVLGTLLVIRIDSGFSLPLPFNILFWHVEAGIAMTLISIFHILWHIPYFKNLINIKKK